MLEYPRIKPFLKSALSVDDQLVYYEVSGNPKGIPVLYIHGGPGGNISPDDRRYFDPDKYKIILFDQRGCGKSKTKNLLHKNTTAHLISDMYTILKKLNIKKVILVGGSWGSTLALIFAIKHPELINSLVLRGVFLANKEDVSYYVGVNSKKHSPSEWKMLIKEMPLSKQKNILEYYKEKIFSENLKEAKKYALIWSHREASLSKKDFCKKDVLKYIKKYDYLKLAKLELHYIINNFFINENFILNNIDKIKNFPVFIIHGKYDRVCNYKNALLLNELFINSKLLLVPSGHDISEKELKTSLINVINHFL